VLPQVGPTGTGICAVGRYDGARQAGSGHCVNGTDGAVSGEGFGRRSFPDEAFPRRRDLEHGGNPTSRGRIRYRARERRPIHGERMLQRKTAARLPAADWLGYALVTFFVVFYTSSQVRVARSLGDELSDHGRYSEANGIRAAEGYFDNGFSSNYGLPDIAYGNAYAQVGGKRDRNMCGSPARCVYLHTAPGAELFAGLATRIFGKGHTGRYRVVPLVLAFASLAFLSWAMARAVGPLRAAFVLATFAAVPMATASMHNLCFLNYELLFFECEIGVLLLCFFRDTRLRVALPALFVLGFLSSWMSFDYVAHVCLGSVVVWLLRGNLRRYQRTMILTATASSAGYFVGCALHLLQVAAFLGSYHAMVADYLQRGMARMNGHVESGVNLLTAEALVVRYGSTLVGPPSFFLGNYALTTTLVFGALLVRLSPPALFSRFVPFVLLAWKPRDSLKWSFLVAILIPYVWIALMRQHATAHQFYVPRNFIVTFLFGALAVAVAVQRVRLEQPSGR
jgi:hypothetical protein